MSQELWYAIGGFSLALISAGAVVNALARSYLQSVEKRLAASDRVQSIVEIHARELLEMGRRLAEFNDRLTRLDGELVADVRRVEAGVAALRESLAELRGELRITEKLRGLLGTRVEDREIKP